VLPLCGTETYTAEQSCQGNIVMDKCGSKWYNSKTQFCYNYDNSKVGNFCGINPQKSYDPDLYECKPSISANGIYLKAGITDSRGNSKHYNAVLIGTQIWMAANLNYNASGSKCGVLSGDGSLVDANNSVCDTYGRLYNWATAMDLPSKCDSNSASNEACYIKKPHQGICPIGWHIPSNEEWDKLYRFADNARYTESPYESPTAGKYLKSQTGWTSCGPSGSGKNYSCEDTHGFSALPGGGGYDDHFNHAGYYGYWWSASEFNSNRAYSRYMEANRDSAYWSSNNHGRGKTILISVRCLRN